LAARPIQLIGAGTAFEGLVSFRGRALIDGELRGEVVASGALHIGEAATVRARIEVDALIVAGSLEGEVIARERIEVLSTARVTGVLNAPRVSLADGCVVDGRCEAGPGREPGPDEEGSKGRSAGPRSEPEASEV
jgi:cytoskeletal protein CcmA (bactofilin family)